MWTFCARDWRPVAYGPQDKSAWCISRDLSGHRRRTVSQSCLGCKALSIALIRTYSARCGSIWKPSASRQADASLPDRASGPSCGRPCVGLERPAFEHSWFYYIVFYVVVCLHICFCFSIHVLVICMYQFHWWYYVYFIMCSSIAFLWSPSLEYYANNIIIL